MGFAQSRAALGVKLPPGPKNVLNVLAFYACELCGHARPGVALIMLNTGLGERAVRQALEELRSNPEILRVWAYPKGGRGVTTEYIVMPGVAKLSTADCQYREKHTKSLHHAQGIGVTGGGNPAREWSKTLHQAQDHPSVHIHPSGGEPASEPAATAPDGAGVEPNPTPPPLSDTAPRSPQTPAEVAAYVKAISTRLHLRTPPASKPGSHRGP
jgi:hypothetical protein